MLFDRLLERVHQRFADYAQSREPATVLCEDAIIEAAELWQAAQPENPAGDPTTEDNRRLALARRTLGWLHVMRHSDLPPGPQHLVELARAVTYFVPLADNLELIPEPLLALVGATADADRQANVAVDLQCQAETTNDPALLDAAIWLLTASIPATHHHRDRAARLSNLGDAYRVRFVRGGALTDVEQSIVMGSQAVAATSDDDPERAMSLSNLGIAYQARFEFGGALTDLDLAVETIGQAVAAVLHDHPDRPKYLANFGNAYRVRYQRSGMLADLDQAVELCARAAAGTPRDDPERGGRLSNLGIAYQLKFANSGALTDVDSAIETIGEAVAATPHDHPHRPVMLTNLCHAYRMRYERSGKLSDLDRAIEPGMQAVAAISHDHSHRAATLANLGAAYLRRFQRSGTLSDLEQGIGYTEQAVSATPDDHSDRPKWLFNLGNGYMARFGRGGVLRDLDQAIGSIAKAVAGLPEDHPLRAAMLSDLGVAYRARFGRGDVLSDLDQAIELGRQATATLDDHPGKAMYLAALSNAYRTRFERGDALSDLEQAIEIGRQAVDTTPDDHPNRGGYLSSLGLAYLRRFERCGVLSDLDDAIETDRQALVAIPSDHANRAVILSDFGNAYRLRYQRSGALGDLDLAIEIMREAASGTPQDHPNRARYLSSLGLAYLRRFEHSGTLADLDRAIEIGAQAVADTPGDHPNRAPMLSYLGLAYRMRFERDDSESDLEQAIEISRQAVVATPDDHPNMAVHLSGLSIAYQRRFERSGAISDVDQALETGKLAVATIPVDHPNRAAMLSNLGTTYKSRHERSGVLADLQHAIENYRQAVAATPDEHADRAKWLFNLANTLRERLRVGGPGIDPQTLHTLVRQVASATNSPPAMRVRAGRAVGSLAYAANEHTIAVQLLDAAVTMLPSVAPREAGWDDQEHRLSDHLGLVGETVAAHCAINDPVGAVQAAEWGRGILLAAQLDSRSDLTDLDRAHPDLATEFRRVRDQLNTPQAADATPPPAAIDSVGQIEHRKRLWTEHDQLLGRIRQHPGFDRFLLPPRLADLQPATIGGAAILVNTGSRRSDAIIVTADADPIHVPLPNATADDIAFHAAELLATFHDFSLVASLPRQPKLSETLGWLWDAVVEPALQAVPPPTADGTSTLPRVWWLPVGLLGLFPLHAAGHAGQFGALDAVISSYIPTLRTLAYAHSRPPATVRRQLTIALRHTPGLPDLPGTVAEATTLHAHHPDTPLLLDETATTSSVLAALPAASWTHFACHASADLTTPSRGGLALHDATLALPEISRLQLDQAELAYLSACSTADRGVRLPDEVLHLASAFQLAGFRHVIASLWPLNDRIAATAAGAVYRHLPATPTADHAATALHHVIRELRAKNPDRPDLWAALIHSGP